MKVSSVFPFLYNIKNYNKKIIALFFFVLLGIKIRTRCIDKITKICHILISLKKEKREVLKMKALKIVGIIVIGILILAMFVGIVYSLNSTVENRNVIVKVNKKFDKKVETLANNSTIVESMVSENAGAISELSDIAKTNKNNIKKNSGNIERSDKVINKNSKTIAHLSATQKELQNITWAHGAKVNRIVKLVFETAFPEIDSLDIEKKVFTYTKEPYSQEELWNEAMSQLGTIETKKILEIAKIQEQTIETKNKISKLKEGCFNKK